MSCRNRSNGGSPREDSKRKQTSSQLVTGGLGEVDGGLGAHAGAAVKDHWLLLGRLVEPVHARKVAW